MCPLTCPLWVTLFPKHTLRSLVSPALDQAQEPSAPPWAGMGGGPARPSYITNSSLLLSASHLSGMRSLLERKKVTGQPTPPHSQGDPGNHRAALRGAPLCDLERCNGFFIHTRGSGGAGWGDWTPGR